MQKHTRFTRRHGRSNLALVLTLFALSACAPIGPDDRVGVSEEAITQTASIRPRIGSGERHTCFLALDSQLYCWGNNDFLQLGTEEAGRSDIAIAIPTPAPFVQIVVGNNHSCGLTLDGVAYCWGRNVEGQLGQSESELGLMAPVIGEHRFRSIAAGANHTCGVTLDRELFCWGLNDAGQVAIGAAEHQNAPEYADLNDVAEVVAGAQHTCALRMSGELMCWGSNVHGQLGSLKRFQSHPWPETVVDGEGFPLRDAVEIASGAQFTCVVRSNLEIWCWGEGRHRAVNPSTTEDSPRAVFANVPQAELVWGGTGDHYGYRKWGGIGCIGRNDSGQLADRDPRRTSGYPAVTGVYQLSTGVSHTCAIDDGERVYCWGSNLDFQLGIGGGRDIFPSALPVLGLPTSPGAPTDLGPGDAIALGSRATCATRSDGNIYCWGSNSFGALGLSTTTYSVVAPNRPIGVEYRPSGPRHFRDVTLGSEFGCALVTADSSPIWCWGRNDRGQLGREVPAGTPVCTACTSADQVWHLLHPSYSAVSAGGAFACAVATGGEVICWGANDVGQLGNGSYLDARTPVDTGLRGVQRIATGRRHACALEPRDGRVSCWGDNSQGQAGTGDFVSVNWARPVSGHYVDVVAGELHTCALDLDGVVWCWGSGSSGQLGDGTGPYAIPPAVGYRMSASPVRVSPTLYGRAVAIAAAERNTCLLNTEGRVYCWGDNELGQLGVGTVGSLTNTRAPTVPVIASGMGTVRQLRLGGRHACATNVIGETWCWGSDSNFQLGRGIYSVRYATEPFLVNWP